MSKYMYNNSFIVSTVKLSLAVCETNQFRGNFMKINLINSSPENVEKPKTKEIIGILIQYFVF